MSAELPAGFTLDSPSNGAELPPGFTLDAQPSVAETTAPPVNGKSQDRLGIAPAEKPASTAPANQDFENRVAQEAAARNANQSALLEGSRALTRGATFGWSPQISGWLNGKTPEEQEFETAVARKQDDLFAEQHPWLHGILSGAGSAGTLAATGGLAGELPIVGEGLAAADNALGNIGYLTAGGRQAARAAVRAGQEAPASLGSTVARGAAIGAPIGASEEMANKGATAENALKGAGEGLVGGAAGSGAMHAAAGIVAPWATKAAQALIKEGVPLTPGETVGGTGQWVENMLGSVPFTGAMTRSAAQTAKEGFNRAVLNRSIQPLEDVLHNINPQGVPHGSLLINDSIEAGHEAFNHAEGVLSRAYDTILPHTQLDMPAAFGTQNYPGPLLAEVNNTLARAAQELEPNAYQRLAGITHRNLVTRLVNNMDPVTGAVPGRSLQQVQSSLRGMVRQFTGDANTDNRQMAYYLRGIENALDDEIMAQTRAVRPALADALQATNKGYAALTIARNASTRAGSNNGVFSPAALMQSVRNADKSVDHVTMARGQALLQDLADAAKSTIKDRPDSGTPERAAFQRLLGAGTEAGAYGAGATTLGPAVFAPMAMGPLFYNPVAKAAFRGLAAGAAPARNAAVQAIRRNATKVAPGAASEAVREEQPRARGGKVQRRAEGGATDDTPPEAMPFPSQLQDSQQSRVLDSEAALEGERYRQRIAAEQPHQELRTTALFGNPLTYQESVPGEPTDYRGLSANSGLDLGGQNALSVYDRMQADKGAAARGMPLDHWGSTPPVPSPMDKWRASKAHSDELRDIALFSNPVTGPAYAGWTAADIASRVPGQLREGDYPSALLSAGSAALAASGAIPGGGAAGRATEGMYPAGVQSNIFLGPKAGNDTAALIGVAKALEREGFTREQIWRATGRVADEYGMGGNSGLTGAFKGADGNWRVEMDDGHVVLPPDSSRENLRYGSPEYEAAREQRQKDWPSSGHQPDLSLFNERYPGAVKDARVWSGPFQTGNGTNYGAIKKINASGKDSAAAKQTLVHELNHTAAQEENWPNGTNPEAAGKMAAASTPEEGLAYYKRNSEETLARAAAQRAHLSPEERAARPPWLDYDIPEHQQIVPYNRNLTYGSRLPQEFEAPPTKPRVRKRMPSQWTPELQETPQRARGGKIPSKRMDTSRFKILPKKKIKTVDLLRHP